MPANPATIQPLAHQGPALTAPSQSPAPLQPAPAPLRLNVPLQAPPAARVARAPATTIQTPAPIVGTPASAGTTPLAEGESVILPPGMRIENGQVMTDCPPAEAQFEWAPANLCGCAPDADRCGTQPYVSPDEFICDGGDVKGGVRVLKNFDVRNIDMTDTIGHFDTLDGRRMVEKSNRVCIYAPRFAAVRRVDRMFAQQRVNGVAQYGRDVRLNSQDHHALVSSMLQPVMPNRQKSALAANAVQELDGGHGIEHVYSPLQGARAAPPFENFEIIQRGVFLNSEKPRLHEHVAAALVWMTNDSVEVMINERRAQAVEQKAKAQETLVYELDGKPRLRICKVASTDNAQPGETVDFTIRFDNMGDQKIGNVTILDSLTTRLEYVPDSQTCTVDGDFFTVENEGSSVILRWEVTEPLNVGEGGVIRFKCKVR